MGGGTPSGQEAGSTQDESARADAGHIASIPCLGANKSQRCFVVQQVEGPVAAGHHQQICWRSLGKGCGGQKRKTRIGGHGSHIVPDQVDDDVRSE